MRIEKSQKTCFSSKITYIDIAGGKNRALTRSLKRGLKKIGNKDVEHIIRNYGKETEFITKYPAELGDVRIKLHRSLFIYNSDENPLTDEIVKKILDYANGFNEWTKSIEKNIKTIPYEKWKQVLEEDATEFVR